MTKEPTDRHFESDDDVIADVDNFLLVQDVDYYQEGICMIQECLSKCVNEGGYYVEMLKTTRYIARTEISR